MTGWLLDTVLYTGLLIALVLVLRRTVGRLFGPQLAYALWALPFLRLLLPPIVLPASLAPQAPAPTAPVAELPLMIEDMPVQVAPAEAAAVATSPVWQWTDVISYAASLWAGVALAFLVWRVVSYQRMRRELLKGARPVGEIGRVRLVETPALAAPVAFGVLDKVIALPPLFMAQPDIASRDLAIAHELAHHKGHDLLANFAAQALLALHWCNPLAWYGWRAMRRDQEAACDARVLAGRGREERIRYAALIAGVATGPRPLLISGALAAPMACPILGERSIVHRLRSLSMSEKSRRRRLFGRSMIAASALALPLTASISYAAANAQAPEPAEPLPPTAEVWSVPAVPATAGVVDPDEPRGPGFVVRQVGPDGKHTVREFSWQVPQPPQGQWRGPQPPQFHWKGQWDSEEFQREMQEFQQEMAQFRERFAEQQGQDWERWAEQYGQHWQQWGEQFAEAQEHRAAQLAGAQVRRAEALAERAHAQAEAQASRAGAQAAARAGRAEARASAAPWSLAMISNCSDEDGTTVRSDNGGQQVVICNRQFARYASLPLRSARESIANNREIDAEVRNDILRDLDEEIVRIESDSD
jgi:bla regulator protein blaR1